MANGKTATAGGNAHRRGTAAPGRRPRSFVPLFTTNLFGTVNDNYLKTLASFTLIGWIADPDLQTLYMAVTAAALVLPYILFSPLADRLATVFNKKTIVCLAKWAELPIVAVAIAGFHFQSAWTVVAAVLLMGLQSSLYSPAKYALVRDVGGEGEISTGMGGMEGIAFGGMLAGTIVASVAKDWTSPRAHLLQWALLVGFALAGVAASHFIRAGETRNRERRAVNPVRFFSESARIVSEYPGLVAVILTLSVFWWGAAMLQMGLVVYGRGAEGLGLGLDATSTGLMLCAAAIGIVAGQVLAGFADKRRPLLAFVPIAGVLAAALLLVLGIAPLGTRAFTWLLMAFSFALGFFKLPLDAEIQRVVKGPRLNTVLAWFNQVSFLFMFAASACYWALSWAFGLRAFLVAMGLAFAVASVWFALSYRPVLLHAGAWILSCRYDIALEGAGCLDGPGPFLVLPNHPAMVDPMIVATSLRGIPLRPLVDERFFRAGPLARLALRTLWAVPVPDLAANPSRDRADAAKALAGIVPGTLAGGGSILLYPAGHIQASDGCDDIGNRRLAWIACRSLPENARVIGVRTDGLWGSIWSRAGRRKSPPFVPTFFKSVFLWLFAVPFMRRRRVAIRIEDLTDRAVSWAQGTRQDFNRRLEEWYAGDPPAADQALRNCTSSS